MQKNQINIDETINSGQVFLWKRHDNAWWGVDGQNIIKVTQNPLEIKCSKKDTGFFRPDDPYKKIIADITQDKTVKKSVDGARGLRLLRQDPFQCYVSFIVSSNSNIQNIKRSLQNICQKFGKKTKFDGMQFDLFPTPKELSVGTRSDLARCGLGYRAKFVHDATRDVLDGKIDFERLKNADYYSAKKELLQINGIGDKVADCILLFSLEKLDAFPLDRWMVRILEKYYPSLSLSGKTLTPARYDVLHKSIVEYFGEYAGYAQQFLFKMERDINEKRWL